MRGLCAAMALAVALAGPAAAQTERFNWDALGAEFCIRALSGDVQGLLPLMTASLAQDVQSSVARAPGQVKPGYLLQSYGNAAPRCSASTHNVALVAIDRSGAGSSWREYLVIAPEPDGSNRIDDILFGTRRSDTLRARLRRMAP